MRFAGIISDTHGLLRPEALSALEGSELIIHAGDIGNPAILEALARIAPVFAVRGNTDRGGWVHAVPETQIVEFDGCSIYVLHDLGQLDLDPVTAGWRGVVSGHTHRAKAETKDGVLYFNPGSAGPRRFQLPACIGRVAVSDGTLVGEIIDLKVS
jgi:uncharacterized protein